jgi:hypothetical protein
MPIKKFNANSVSGGLVSGATVSSSAPAAPSNGALWLHSSTGTLLTYYDSGTNTQWLQPVGPAGAAGAAGATGAAGVAGATGAAANPLPTGNTAQRPVSPVSGNMRINSETNYVELYYNSTWFNLTYIGLVTATSANSTVTYSGDYAIHTFLTSGAFTPTYVPVGGTIEYLIVGGGGAGGREPSNPIGAGGGAGGFLTASGYSVAATTYVVTVGAGGVGTSGSIIPGNGSSVFGLTAAGGGGGGTGGADGGNGGSGGGGGGGGTGGTRAGGKGIYPGSTYIDSVRQGYNGGSSFGQDSVGPAGGGGGAGAVGASASTSVAGNGGAGLFSSINGTTTAYAGGGGGATISGTNGTGGNGGGGNASTNGTANRGGGGGGGNASTAGNGGSGIVIIRYRYQ